MKSWPLIFEAYPPMSSTTRRTFLKQARYRQRWQD